MYFYTSASLLGSYRIAALSYFRFPSALYRIVCTWDQLERKCGGILLWLELNRIKSTFKYILSEHSNKIIPFFPFKDPIHMPLENSTTSFSDFIPYQQPLISCARDLPLPKRRSKSIKWEKTARCKTKKQKKIKKKSKPVATTTLHATPPPLSSENASCNTDSCQADSVKVDSLDKDNTMLIAALLAFDPSIALVLNVNDAWFYAKCVQ